MKYKLASSSTEEGEVHENTFPYTKSHLKYLYYPRTNIFIGPNTLPVIANYKSESVCQKLKKDVKADYSYISFTILDNSKAFFDNSFTVVGDLGVNKNELKLMAVDSAYKDIPVIRRGEDSGKYNQFFQRHFFSKEPPGSMRVFVLEDRMLQCLNNPNAYLFFRVSEHRETGAKRYVFEDVFYSQSGLYEYLEIYGEILVKSQGSVEIRLYSSEDTEIHVHSSTVFMNEGKKRRLYSVPDEARNAIIVMNKEGPVLAEIQGRKSEELENLLRLTVGEGDYIINGKIIYKMGDGKVKFEYKGLIYDDIE